MNALVSIFGRHLDGQARSGSLVALLERVCRAIAPTSAQCSDVEGKYEAVGGYLASSGEPMFRTGIIFAHGSFATGTAARPLNRTSFDVDLIWHVPDPALALQPATLKRTLGDRLRAHDTYRRMLEEKARCWRLNYADGFHMDITPAIPNEACRNGGCLVPDKALRRWKESHPRGYRMLFERRAALVPTFRMMKSVTADSLHAQVEPFPDQARMTGYLRRIVQLAKRSRDIYFDGHEPRVWPISVILTTLASRSYQWCVTNQVFEDELELLCQVVAHMPNFIDLHPGRGATAWAVWNETTEGENFAEKWNSEPDRAEAFFAWHRRFASDLSSLRSAVGLDTVRNSLSHSFGPEPVKEVFDGVAAFANLARRDGALALAPGSGLAYGHSPKTAVRPNTFFGRD